MTKKDVVFLLLPCALFLAIGVLALRFSSLLVSPSDARFQHSSQRNFEQVIEKVRSGEVDREKTIELLRSSREVSEAQELARDGTSRLLRWLGWSVVIGTALQVYIVVRISGKKRDPNQIR